jgi:hypothetical protein
LIPRGSEPRVALSTSPAFGHNYTTVRLIEVRYKFSGVHIKNLSARWNGNVQIFSGFARLVFASSILTFTPAIKLLVLAVEEGIQRFIGPYDYISAFTAVTTVWPTPGNESFSAKTYAAIPSLSRYHFDSSLINKFQVSLSDLTIKLR